MRRSKGDSKSHPRGWPGHATQFAVAEGGKFDRALTGRSRQFSETVSAQHVSSVNMLADLTLQPCARVTRAGRGAAEVLSQPRTYNLESQIFCKSICRVATTSTT